MPHSGRHAVSSEQLTIYSFRTKYLRQNYTLNTYVILKCNVSPVGVDFAPLV